MFSHSSRHRNILFMAAVAGGAACMLCAMIEVACAQGAFGVGRAVGMAAAADGGVFSWVLAKQAAYYREFAGLIRAAKVDGAAFYGLLGLSFTYGIFHAAGPGHGKAVISSYLVANGESWRRGVALSFTSALLQALAAVAIVGIAAAMLGATAKTMGNAVRAIEVASYLAIFVVGPRLVWTKARDFAMELRGWSSNRHNPNHPDEHHERCCSGRIAIAVHHVDTAHGYHAHQIMAPTVAAGIRTGLNQVSWPVGAGGGAELPRSSPSACALARGPYLSWYSPWLRACSGSVWRRPSRWALGRRSQWRLWRRWQWERVR
jgi:nickel/cobalt transporter (NicO) family protein